MIEIIVVLVMSFIIGFVAGYCCGKDQGKLETFEENQTDSLFDPYTTIAEQAGPQKVKS